MSLSPLAKKLQIKPGNRVLVLNSPADAPAALEPLPEGAEIATTIRGEFDVVLLFAHHSKDLERHVPKAVKAVREGGILWIAYPKKSSKVDSDLTRDVGWGAVEEAGFVGVSQVAIDATWSALRFRPGSEAERKGAAEARSAARPSGHTRAGGPPTVEAPADLAKALAKSDAARALWEAMAYSHRKEYVGWIEEAKKAETRARRVDKAIEMMAAGQKDRNAKYRG
jgi:hypothetical protein